MNRLYLLASLLLSAVVLGAPGSALAWKNIWLPSDGLTYIGVIKENGVSQIVAITRYYSGGTTTCFKTYIEKDRAGLLTDVQVYGTANANIIAFVESGSITISDCPTTYTMTPLGFAGRAINIFGDGGADAIVGWGDTFVYGEGGDDVLVAPMYAGTEVHGGAGNDRLNGRGHAVHLYGGDGNDRLCADFASSSASVSTMSGGNGTDNRCGTATAMSSIETVNCSLVCTLL